MPDPLTITILEQGWLAGSEADYDLCSHGRLRISVGGSTITQDSAEYGISESALALLRTLTSDHSPERPVADRLILHGCGASLMATCPIGIDFRVRHLEGSVVISDLTRFDTTNEGEAVAFPGLVVTMPIQEYQSVVINFARQAKGLFEGVAKRCDDEFERNEYREFWAEFDELVANFQSTRDRRKA